MTWLFSFVRLIQSSVQKTDWSFAYSASSVKPRSAVKSCRCERGKKIPFITREGEGGGEIARIYNLPVQITSENRTVKHNLANLWTKWQADEGFMSMVEQIHQFSRGQQSLYAAQYSLNLLAKYRINRSARALSSTHPPSLLAVGRQWKQKWRSRLLSIRAMKAPLF